MPILIVVAFWFALRLRFVRRAGAAQQFIDAAPDLDLFALRAMANQPMPRLARISDDPAGVAARRARRHPRPGPARAEGGEAAPPPPLDVLNRLLTQSAAAADSRPAHAHPRVYPGVVRGRTRAAAEAAARG